MCDTCSVDDQWLPPRAPPGHLRGFLAHLTFASFFDARLARIPSTPLSGSERPAEMKLAVMATECKEARLLQTPEAGSCAAQVRHTGSHLLQELLGSWQLRRQLCSLRNLYLGGAPVLLPFVYEVVGRLLEGEPLTDIHDADLQAALDESLRGGGNLAPLPHLTTFSGGLPTRGCLQCQTALPQCKCIGQRDLAQGVQSYGAKLL